MSVLSVLAAGAALIPKLLGVGARYVGMRAGKLVRVLDGEAHQYPRPNSVEEWEVGENTCFKCLRHDPSHTAFTVPRCPGKRPKSRPPAATELP